MAQHSSTADLLNLTGIDPLVKNFIELISFDTRAEPESKAIPSSVGQLRFGAYLCSLIRDLGFDARQDEKGMVKVSIAATKGCENAKRLMQVERISSLLLSKTTKAEISSLPIL